MRNVNEMAYEKHGGIFRCSALRIQHLPDVKSLRIRESKHFQSSNNNNERTQRHQHGELAAMAFNPFFPKMALFLCCVHGVQFASALNADGACVINCIFIRCPVIMS